MKLFSVLLATASAITCPNGWTSNGENPAKCRPDGLQVECTTDKMKVTMGLNHLYYNGETMFDRTQILAAKAHAGNCEIVAGKVNAQDSATLDTGAVTEFSLGDCGTVPTHENGNLVFTTTFKVSY